MFMRVTEKVAALSDFSQARTHFCEDPNRAEVTEEEKTDTRLQHYRKTQLLDLLLTAFPVMVGS